MRLKTTVGAYAGQIREYAFTAAQAALKTGAAERIEPAPSAPVRSTPQPAAPSAKRRTR
jgi:hypothetical protein